MSIRHWIAARICPAMAKEGEAARKIRLAYVFAHTQTRKLPDNPTWWEWLEAWWEADTDSMEEFDAWLLKKEGRKQ